MTDTPSPLSTPCRSAFRAFSRAALALLVMMALFRGVAYALEWLVSRYLPSLLTAEWFLWTAGTLPLYLIGIPAAFLILRTLPASPPTSRATAPGDLPLFYLMGYGGMLLAD